MAASTVTLTGAPELRVFDGAKPYARNTSIQYLRGFAAASVVLCHASVADGRFGVYGVSLFFAISGYLMSGLVRSTEPFRFLTHRILRIYPIFFLVIGFSFIARRFLGVPFAFDALALTLAPVGLRSFSLGGIEWTLVFELTYYTALFVLACAKLQRQLEVIAVAWIGVILGSTLLIPSLSDKLYLPIHLLLLAPANLAFAGGLLVPSAISRGYLPRASVLLVIPAALAYDFVDLGANRLLSGVAATCLVGWAAQSKTLSSFQVRNPLRLLGDWSYALYLCHVPVIQIVTDLWPTSSLGSRPDWFSVGAVFLVLLLIGPLDIALYRRLKTLADTAPPRTTQLTICAFVAAFLGLAAYGSTSHVLNQMENLRIQSTLEQLGSNARKSPEIAGNRISEVHLALSGSLQGAFERIDALSDGRMILRGWVLIDEDASTEIGIRAFCKGREISVDRLQRKLRPDIAESLGRQDIAKERIGFALFASQKACPKGAQAFVIVFDEAAKAAVLPGVQGL